MSDKTSDIDGYLSAVAETPFFQAEKVKKGRVWIFFEKSAFPEGSFEYYVDYYRRRAPGRMLRFRLSGTLVIILGAALPVVAAFGDYIPELFPGQNDILLSAIAALIALSTGLNAFFRWDTAWQGYIGAQLALERLRQDWEIAVAEARTHPDAVEGREKAKEATERFVARTYEVIEAETKGYFTNQSFPEGRDQSMIGEGRSGG